MHVNLKVMHGANAGKVIRVPLAEFLIGRDEQCHLRPKSDAIGRRHCAVLIQDNRVIVKDFQSKNGTFVNSERVEGQRELSPGDLLQVGPLAFQVLFDHSLGGAKRARPENVKEVAQRTAGQRANDLDISSWLEEADVEASSGDLSTSDTRQLRLDDTGRVPVPPTPTAEGAVPDQPVEESGSQKLPSASSEDSTSDSTADSSSGVWSLGRKKAKPKPGKLPTVPKVNTADSREAAADMLKKFFNRG